MPATESGFIRGKTIAGKGFKHSADHLRVAVAHNKREGKPSPNIDPTRSGLNVCIEGTHAAADVLAQAAKLMACAGINTTRKNGIRAFEFLVSLPVGTAVEPVRYFRTSLDWLKARFALPVLTADIHLDESAPHCHILLLPLRDGARIGRREILGDALALRALGRDFGRDVAEPHGLRAPPTRLRPQARETLIRLVIESMTRNADPAMQSAVWPGIREAIERDPRPFASTLGIEAPAPKSKKPRSFVAIMTSPGKGPKTEAAARHADALKGYSDFAKATQDSFCQTHFDESVNGYSL